MAQTGYTPISIYYSSTATNVPTAGNLVAGELAINTADGKLFYKDSAGVVQTMASKATGAVAGTTTQVIYNNAGAYAGSANMVFDGSTLTTLNSAYTGTFTGGTGVIAIGTNQIYKDASGNVGIGTASPASKLDVKAGSGSVISRSTSGINFKAFYDDGRTTYTSLNYDGLSTSGAQDLFITSGQSSIFRINANSSSAEAMRIDTSGLVLIGKTADSLSTAGVRLSTDYSSFTSTGIALYANRQGSDGGLVEFRRSNATVGSISVTTSLTSYNVTSDRRLKENIAPLTTGLASVLSLKPSQYNYKANPTTLIQGFIADELQKVVPHAVSGEANAVDKDGKPVYQGVDVSFLIPFLVSAIQELNAKITALENK